MMIIAMAQEIVWSILLCTTHYHQSMFSVATKTLRIFDNFWKKCQSLKALKDFSNFERIINHLCSSFWNPNILLVPSIFNVRSNTVTVVTRLFLFIQTWPGYSYMTDIRYSQEVDTNTVFYAKITLFLPPATPHLSSPGEANPKDNL